MVVQRAESPEVQSMPAARALRAASIAPEVNLRAAHKALTRERIREAAKALFHSSSIAAVTIDQIAVAAGVSRPTIYVHYKDKDEVIRDIVRVYGERSLAMNRLLPGPVPTAKQLRAWLDQKVEFYREDRVSLALLYQAGHRDPDGPPSVVRSLMTDVLEVYAERLPAFRAALTPGPHQPHARIRVEMLVRQITVACEFCAREGLKPEHRAALDITAEAFLELHDRLAAISAEAAKTE
jgi:AcrR family transcriptional regulator